MSKLQANNAEHEDDEEQQSSAHEDAVDEDDSDGEFESDGEPEKDETEVELERLVFGDSAGFREGLRDFAREEREDEGAEEETTGLEGLDNADVG